MAAKTPSLSFKDFSGLLVLSKDTGLPITSVQSKTESITRPEMMGNLLDAIKIMLSTYKIGELHSFSTNTHNILIQASKKYIFIIIMNLHSNLEEWNAAINRISLGLEELLPSLLKQDAKGDKFLLVLHHLNIQFKKYSQQKPQFEATFLNAFQDSKSVETLKSTGFW